MILDLRWIRLLRLHSLRHAQCRQDEFAHHKFWIGDSKNIIIEVLAYNIAGFVPERAYFKKFIYA